MQVHNLVAIVTFLALLLYLWTGIRVARARVKHKIMAPAVSGHPEFERAYRVQMNTLEWLPVFLVSMWLFAHYWDGRLAASIGLVWILGRLLYAISYVKDPTKRGPGFGLQAATTLVLLLGGLGKAITMAVSQGL
jgi:uncharacterized membrane protein YecN with MAPEG domain